MFSMAKHQGVGHTIRQARTARSMSLRTLAAHLRVSHATLSAVETGQTPLTVERLQQIAEVLEVPAARLLRGDAAPTVVEHPATSKDWRTFDAIDLSPILEAATRVFVRQGFHAASMREIAAEAGLSVAGVYHHHASKEQLLAEILHVTMTEIQWRIEAARQEGAEDGHGPLVSYALMVESLALFHAVRGDLAFLGASEMRGLTGQVHDRVVAMRNRVQYTMDEQADRCLDAGVFTCPDPHTVGRAISTMCTSLPSWFRADGPLSAQEVASRYADLALTMMGATQTPTTKEPQTR